VSVVIPAYQAERTLAAAIESVLSQTYTDIDVIVVDDGSTDATGSVAQSYGSPVTVIRTSNAGVSAARNTGIERSSGELIAFLDADDLWAPSKLARQVEVMDSDESIGLVTTSATAVGANLEVLEERRVWPTDDPCAILLLNSMVLGQLSSALLRRDVVVELGGFDRRFSQCADWDFFLRTGTRSRIATIDEQLVLYRTAQASMSSNIALLESDTFAVLDAFFASPAGRRYDGLRKRAYSNHWMILSGSYLHAGQLGSSVRCLLNGLRLYPANIGRAIGMPVRRLRRRPAARLSTTHS
jgi:glycosyltransferase involved in cell wall biosynthesis